MNKDIKWVLLGLLGLLVVLGFAISIVAFVMKMMKGDAYQMSLYAISANDQVIEMMGEPIQESWYVLGNVNKKGSEGTASLEYSIEGPKGSGKVYVYATRTIGEWKLDKVVVSNDQSMQRISVVGEQE
ncbi:MAG: hypothetical protein Tsb002_13180 [Wenzhouxiangellaceae bacterium]